MPTSKSFACLNVNAVHITFVRVLLPSQEIEDTIPPLFVSGADGRALAEWLEQERQRMAALRFLAEPEDEDNADFAI